MRQRKEEDCAPGKFSVLFFISAFSQYLIRFFDTRDQTCWLVISLSVFCCGLFHKLDTSPADSLFHVVLLDQQHEAFQRGTKNFCNSILQSLASIGFSMSCEPDAFVLDVSTIMELLQTDLHVRQ